MEPINRTPAKNEYRTTSAYQWDERRLLLRGGKLDGLQCSSVIGVGKRVFCGPGPWSMHGVYLVTARVELTEDGQEANVAVPAFAESETEV